MAHIHHLRRDPVRYRGNGSVCLVRVLCPFFLRAEMFNYMFSQFSLYFHVFTGPHESISWWPSAFEIIHLGEILAKSYDWEMKTNKDRTKNLG